MDYIKGANKIFTNERSWIKDNSVKIKRSKFELQIERLKDFVSTLQIFAKCEYGKCRKYRFVIENVAGPGNLRHVTCWSNKNNGRRHAVGTQSPVSRSPEGTPANAPNISSADRPTEPLKVKLLQGIKEKEVGHHEILNDNEKLVHNKILQLRKIDCENLLGKWQDLEKAMLFDYFKRMPKAGHLHCHLKAISTDVLLEKEISKKFVAAWWFREYADFSI